jgi:hypothetical protein
MKETRFCAVCEKEIEVKWENFGGRRRERTQKTSDEGIYFVRVWFCNECWKKIIKEVKNESNNISKG